jgi:oligoendopeptidase F
MCRRLLVVALFTLAAFPAFAADPVRTELATKEKQLEQLYAEYWRTEYRIAQGEKNVSSLDVQKRILEVVADEGFLARLKVRRFRDPTLMRRQYLFLEEAVVTKISSDPELARLVEEITRDEAEMHYRVGDRQLARSELRNLLGHDSHRELRRQAWNAMAQLTAKTGERIRQAMKLRIALAQKHARRPFADLMLDRKGIQGGRERLMQWFEEIGRETDSTYRELLNKIKSELKVERVEPWDLSYYFSTLTGDFEQKVFVPEEAWAKIVKAAAPLGYDFQHPPVDVKITEITFGGGTYPILYGREVKILINKYRGLRFVDTLFHESGHALHYSFNNEPSFLLQANYAEPFDEGLGQVMALMLYRPEVAGRIFGLTPEQVHAIKERYRLQSLYDLRETIADSMFEFEAYANPDQDLNKLYNRVYSKYLGVEVPADAPSVWAFDPFYSSGPIYLQSYVLAEMVGRQIHHALDEKFGPRWGKSAGKYMREKFFSRGGRLTLDEIMKEGTGEPLTAKYLIEALKEPHPEATSKLR